MLVELKPSHCSEKELGGHGRLFSKLNEGYIRMYLRLACPGLFVTLWRAQRPHEKSGKPRPSKGRVPSTALSERSRQDTRRECR